MRTCESGLWLFFSISAGAAWERYVRANKWGCRKVYVSFGGLLLFLEGPYKNLTPLRIDYVYLCMKK